MRRTARWQLLLALSAGCGQTEQPPAEPPETAQPRACPIATCASSRGTPSGSWWLLDACSDREGTLSELELGGALDIGTATSTFWPGTTLVTLNERALLLLADGQTLEGRYCQEGDGLTISAPGLELQFARAECMVGQRSCEGNHVLECSSDARLVPTAACGDYQACHQGVCVPRCEPLSLYCTAEGERRCGEDGLRLGVEPGARCADGVACLEGSGCDGPRSLTLGREPSDGSLCNVGFAGDLVQASADVTLRGYELSFSTYGPSTTLEWQVFEARYPTGQFNLVWSQATAVEAGNGHATPELSLALTKGRYYLLGVSIPPSTLFSTGSPGETNLYAEPMGVVYLPTSPPSEPFTVEAIPEAPRALLGSALLEP